MELREGKIRSTYVIESIALPLQTEKRLEALGMTRGTPISVLNRKRCGTMIVHVRGSTSIEFPFHSFLNPLVRTAL